MLHFQSQRVAGTDRVFTPSKDKHISGSTAAAKHAREGYRPVSAALSLRSFGRSAGPRSPSTTARPVTALPKSPSLPENAKKVSPKKAASAGPAIRKASAAITRGWQLAIPEVDEVHETQQENQIHGPDGTEPVGSTGRNESDVRLALQESPTRSPAGLCVLAASNIFACLVYTIQLE